MHRLWLSFVMYESPNGVLFVRIVTSSQNSRFEVASFCMSIADEAAVIVSGSLASSWPKVQSFCMSSSIELY